MIEVNWIVWVGIVLFDNIVLFSFIVGFCQMESWEMVLECVVVVKEIVGLFGILVVFKSFFDKVNRMFLFVICGVGLKNVLLVFVEIKEIYGLLVLIDIYFEDQCVLVVEVVDVFQIFVFLCCQIDLLVVVVWIGVVVNVKKGQFLVFWDMKNVLKKIIDFGNFNVLLIEWGVSFGYNILVSDMCVFLVMVEIGVFVVFDVMYFVQ